MNHKNIITISQRGRWTLAWLLAGLSILAVQLIAHGGFDHVIGTVVKFENNVLTVKTSKGNVDVRLNEKTEITKSDQKAEIADLKPGARVVVDIPEGSKDKVAHSVKVGVSSPASARGHSTHE
jgi:hypothetical protein